MDFDLGAVGLGSDSEDEATEEEEKRQAKREERLPAASLLQQIVELHQKLDESHATNLALQDAIKTLLRANLDLSNDLRAARSAIVFLSKGRAVELEAEEAAKRRTPRDNDSSNARNNVADADIGNKSTSNNGDPAKSDDSDAGDDDGDSSDQFTRRHIPPRAPTGVETSTDKRNPHSGVRNRRRAAAGQSAFSRPDGAGELSTDTEFDAAASTSLQPDHGKDRPQRQSGPWIDHAQVGQANPPASTALDGFESQYATDRGGEDADGETSLDDQRHDSRHSAEHRQNTRRGQDGTTTARPPYQNAGFGNPETEENSRESKRGADRKRLGNADDDEDQFDDFVARIQREDLLEKLQAASAATKSAKAAALAYTPTGKHAKGDLLRPSDEQFATLDALQEALRSSTGSDLPAGFAAGDESTRRGARLSGTFVDRAIQADAQRLQNQQAYLAYPNERSNTSSMPLNQQSIGEQGLLGGHQTHGSPTSSLRNANRLSASSSHVMQRFNDESGKPPQLYRKPRQPVPPLERNYGMVREIFRFYLDVFDKSFLVSPRAGRRRGGVNSNKAAAARNGGGGPLRQLSRKKPKGGAKRNRMTFEQLRIFAVNFRVVPSLLSHADLEQWWRLMGEPPLLNLEQFAGFLRWTAVRAYV